MPLEKRQVNLNRLVEESLYFVEARCRKHGIKLVRSFSEDLPEITADWAQLSQALVNLLVNGLQAMPEGGKLTIRTTGADGKGHVSLIVEDTGVGMTEEVAQKVFVPFYTTKEVGHGTGLGLAVVHGIVTSHGGTVRVDSKAGQGTRFTIRLPLAAPECTAEKGENVLF